MPVFGIDVSDFQAPLAGMVPAVKHQGFDFIIAKCTEGSTFAAPSYPKFLAGAKQAGMLFGAYHFLHHGDAANQAQNYVNRCVDKSIPVMIDLEADGATLADANAFRLEVKKLGVSHCLLYIPHWYWEGHIGSPSLAAWDGRVVSSAYPSTRHAYASTLYAGQGNGVGWQPYGGVKPTIWQFADSVKIDGYTGNVDGDVFAGTLDELRSQVPFKDFSSQPTPKPTPKPAPKPQPTTLTVIGWNCHVANTEANVHATLVRWASQHNPDVFCLSEAGPHANTLRKIPGYTVFQETPGRDVGGIINEQGDSAVLVRDNLATKVKSDRVAKMLKRWKVIDPKHPNTHQPRRSQVVVLDFHGRKVRIRADHAPTHGFHGANATAFLEFATRAKAWAALTIKATSLSVGDWNETVAAIARWFGKGFTVVGSSPDLIAARNVKKVTHTELDMGGSDHHGQLYRVLL